jgi:flagellar basal-body rod modification protein FlgD
MAISPITGSSQTPAQLKSSKKDLKSQDFINMMITQLQNQDPLEPTKNQDLLAQMSQIGQLQSSTKLQDTLSAFVLQSQITAGGSMIGKMVEGLDDKNDTVSGLVTAVKVQANEVLLELDTGKKLTLANVTRVAPGSTATDVSTANSTDSNELEKTLAN